MTKLEIEHTLSGMRAKLLATARHFIKVSGLAEDEEDIVQEAMTELWRLFESDYQIRNAEALVVKITKTICVRHYRQRHIQTTTIEGLDFSGGKSASEGLELQDTLNVRQSLWARLSDTQKKYLNMKNEQGMSLDEIAQATGHPKASIKATISQARRMMYEQFKKYGNE